MKFLCEIDQKKQTYLQTAFPGRPIFQDASDLGRPHAPTVDGAAEAVPSVARRRGRFLGFG